MCASKKTDQLRVGFKRKLYRSGDDELCVVQAFLDHIRATAKLASSAPVCAYGDRSEENDDDELWPCVTRKGYLKYS